jgi:nucleoid DNA-binding protein/cell division protein FtsN
MKKKDFIKRVAKVSGVAERETATILNSLFELVARNLEKGLLIRLAGIGTFSVKQRAARSIKDRSTGQKREIPSHRSPSFAAAKLLADGINEKYRNLETLVVATPEQLPTEDIYFIAEKAPSVDSAMEARSVPQGKVHVEENASAKLNSMQSARPVSVGNYERANEDVDIDKIFDEIMRESSVNQVKGLNMPNFNFAQEEKQRLKVTQRGLDASGSSLEVEEEVEEGPRPEQVKKSRRWLWLVLAVCIIAIAAVAFFLSRSSFSARESAGKEASAVPSTKVDSAKIAAITVQPTSVPSDTAKGNTPGAIAQAPAMEGVGEKTTPDDRSGSEVVQPPKGKLEITIQVSSWKRKSDAEKQLEYLKQHGFSGYIEEAVVPWKGGKWYRVRVGHYATENDAQIDAASIESIMGQNVVVTK